jgi:hypothetical protein
MRFLGGPTVMLRVSLEKEKIKKSPLSLLLPDNYHCCHLTAT